MANTHTHTFIIAYYYFFSLYPNKSKFFVYIIRSPTLLTQRFIKTQKQSRERDTKHEKPSQSLSVSLSLFYTFNKVNIYSKWEIRERNNGNTTTNLFYMLFLYICTKNMNWESTKQNCFRDKTIFSLYPNFEARNVSSEKASIYDLYMKKKSNKWNWKTKKRPNRNELHLFIKTSLKLIGVFFFLYTRDGSKSTLIRGRGFSSRAAHAFFFFSHHNPLYSLSVTTAVAEMMKNWILCKCKQRKPTNQATHKSQEKERWHSTPVMPILM